MEVYPTPPGVYAERAEHVESSGKPEGMLSKVKRKARDLRDKIKKATGTDSTDNDHGDINRRDQEDELRQHAPGPEDEAESCEENEEEHGHINPADNQFKSQQLHSIGALDNQEGGPEVEVNGGVPVTALGATPDTHLKSADDDSPISPYKNDGTPAAPTEDRNYVADNDPLLQLGGEGKTTTDTSDVNLVRAAEGNNSRGMNQQPDSLGLPTLAEGKMATSPAGTSRNSATSDMDVAYPEDLVKPNPEFGHSSSSTYDKIGVMNEDLSTDRKLGTSEDYSNKGKEDVLEASVPECTELSGYQSSASVPVEANELVDRPVSELSAYQSSAPMPIKADELVYRPVSDPDEGSSLTPPPGILDADVNERNAIAQAAGSRQSIDNSTQQAFANELEYPSTHDDDKSLSLEQSPHGEVAEPEKNQHESWSKWSADKHDKVKDEGSLDGVTYEPNVVAQSYGTGESLDNRTSAFEKETDYPSTSAEEKAISDTADGVENLSLEQSAHGETVDGAVPMRVGSGDRAPNLQDDEYVDALSKPRVSEDVRKDVGEEDFYDSNAVKDNQFQEGFALGSGDADEDALNSTLPGSAIGKLQGLNDSNASSPHTEGGGDGKENPYFEREDVNFSPTQQTGFVQGPKDTVASTFGSSADEFSHGVEGEQSPVAERDHKSEDSQPKDTVASTFGNRADEFSHGDEGEQSPVAEREHKPEVDIDGSQPKDTVASTFGNPADEFSHGDEGEQSRVAEREHKPEVEMDGSQPQTGALASKLGYGTAGESPSPSENMGTHNIPIETTADVQPRYDDSGDDADRSHSPGVFQGMKNMVASTFGYNGSEGARTAETEHKPHDKVPRTAETEHKPHDKVPAVSSAEGESHSKQQTGVFQGWKNMVGF